MRKSILFVLMLILLLATATSFAQEQTYTVQAGDNLQGIANAFNVDLDALLIRNNIIDPNSIRRGDTLIIPQGTFNFPRTHVVQPGERLNDIAMRFNTTVDELVRLNLLGNPNFIFPGQVLNLPSVTSGTPPAAGGPITSDQIIRVEIGDTLNSIARRFGVSVASIVARNSIRNPNRIFAGMQLIIPAPGTTPTIPPPVDPIPPSNITYVVQAGDTLELIAQRFNVTVESIRLLNNITDNRAVFPGDVLLIPPTGGPIVQPPLTFPPRRTVNGFYIVRPGDNLFAIGADFGVNIFDIARANNILNLNSIFIGQALRIPGR